MMLENSEAQTFGKDQNLLSALLISVPHHTFKLRYTRQLIYGQFSAYKDVHLKSDERVPKAHKCSIY